MSKSSAGQCATRRSYGTNRQGRMSRGADPRPWPWPPGPGTAHTGRRPRERGPHACVDTAVKSSAGSRPMRRLPLMVSPHVCTDPALHGERCCWSWRLPSLGARPPIVIDPPRRRSRPLARRRWARRSWSTGWSPSRRGRSMTASGWSRPAVASTWCGPWTRRSSSGSRVRVTGTLAAPDKAVYGLTDRGSDHG